MISTLELANIAMHKWFEREYKLTPEHALEFENWQDWQNIINAFIDGWMACFWMEDCEDGFGV